MRKFGIHGVLIAVLSAVCADAGTLAIVNADSSAPATAAQAALLAGLAPAWHAWRANLNDSLKSIAPDPRRARLRMLLTVAQVAFDPVLWAVLCALATTLLLLAFTTPWLINKQPGKRRAADFHPLIAWTALNLFLAATLALHQLWPTAGIVLGVAVVGTVFAWRNSA